MPDPKPWDQFINTTPVRPDSSCPVVVIGAGLAGCWMARTLAQAGVRVIVLEQGASVATGASSNPAGIAKPFVTRAPCLAMSFYVEAHRYLREQLFAWNLADACEWNDCGVAQLVDQPYPASSHFASLAPADMQHTLGLPSDSNAIHFEQAGWLNPAALCHTLLEHELINLQCECATTSIVYQQALNTNSQWQIELEDGDAIQTSNVVICAGISLCEFAMTRAMAITPARGQISRFQLETNSPSLKTVVSGKHYIIPDGNTVLVGATFKRGDSHSAVVPDDNLSNGSGLGDTLPALQVQPDAVEAFAGVRATTPDRLPLVGPVPDTDLCAAAYADLKHGRMSEKYPPLPVHAGAYVLGGLGSRGIVTAPFAAKLLTDLMLGGSEINAWSTLINPARFQIRALKRGKPDA